MASISYKDLERRLTPEALSLLRQMVSAHLRSTGDRMFIRSDSMGGTHMIFTGEGAREDFTGFDGAAIQDLISWGLLHMGYSRRGTPNYRVSGEAIQFHRWWMEQQGSPLSQIEEQVRRVVDSAVFAQAHPDGLHHLREAFDLLWSGRTDEQTVSEIGDHLRKALMDATSDVVDGGVSGLQEKPIQRLRAHISELRVPDREVEVLTQVVELARVVLRLDHRLNHIRDEADQGEPAATWEEVRRAAFSTALACYELGRLRAR